MPTNNLERLSVNIKEYRLKMGITQDGLAKLLDISRGCVANYEAGTRCPDADMINKLAKHLNVPVERLTGAGSSYVTLKEDEVFVYEQRKKEAEKFGDTINLSEVDFFSRVEIIDFFTFLKEKLLREKDRR